MQSVMTVEVREYLLLIGAGDGIFEVRTSILSMFTGFAGAFL
jgi:hypothetical protein